MHDFLRGMGSVLDLIPTPSTQQDLTVAPRAVHPRVRRFFQKTMSVEEAFAQDKAALQGDVIRVGQDFWNALDHLTEHGPS